MLSISSTTEVKIDLKGMEASTNCFFVVVGGKYLRLMDKVMDIVDKVTEDVGRRPLAVFYVTKDEKKTTFYDQRFHLPLVINLRSININPPYWCRGEGHNVPALFSRWLFLHEKRDSNSL